MIKLLISIFVFLISVVAVPAQGEDFTALGGGMSREWLSPAAIQVYGPDVTSPERQLLQLDGFGPFHRIFQKQEGLGPGFVNASCGGCHVENGRGLARFDRSGRSASPGGSLVVKVQYLKGNQSPTIGPVLQNHSIDGTSKFDLRLRWEKIRGEYLDGSRYSISAPLLSFAVPGLTSYRKVASSLRMTPPVIGVGLIEAIDPESILLKSDPFDLDGDGISGRPNYVTDIRSGKLKIGRFGFKAGQPTVEQQSAAALGNEMGMSNSLFNVDDSIEFDDELLKSVTIYQKLAGVPAARNQSAPDVQYGRSLFFAIGCESCHSSTFVTGQDQNPELSGQKIHPFSDFLLHDMGKGLADKHREGIAKGSEWKTTPLWGLGFSKYLSKVSPRYLHDARAGSLEEAIIWHGGEAEQSRNLFIALPKKDRVPLIKFLLSL